MTTINYNETVNTEREKANLLCLIKLALNALIDQSFSTTSLPILDDHNADVTNFILALERVLSFRMRANWLSERRYFWDFIRPACIGSCRQSSIERVDEISKSYSTKTKGRIWIKIALMEKKLSELLKLVISDCHLVQKFYHDDSIMASSQAFILCDQLAALNTIDFGFCFKQNDSVIAPVLLNDAEIDVIDLIPFLHFKPKHEMFINLNNREDNKELSSIETITDEINSSQYNGVPLEKYKLEIEQRKYFEELLQHRDRQLQQLKIRYDILKDERETEIVQLENIIIELQFELRIAREQIDIKQKRLQPLNVKTSPKNSSNSDNRKISASPSRIANEHTEDIDQQMSSIEDTITDVNSQDLNHTTVTTMNEKRANDITTPSPAGSRHSTTSNITDDEHDETISKFSSIINNDSNQLSSQLEPISSPELVSVTNSIQTPSSSSSSVTEEDKQMIEILPTDFSDENHEVKNESN